MTQKQKFLQRKGLSDREIQIACEKSGAYAYHEQQNVSPLPPLSNAVTNYKSHNIIQLSFFDRIREIVHNIAIFSIVAYVIHKFYQVSNYWNVLFITNLLVKCKIYIMYF